MLDNWDRTEINLPFSHGAIVVGEPIRVPKEADAHALKTARATLERALNAATERAHIMPIDGLESSRWRRRRSGLRLSAGYE